MPRDGVRKVRQAAAIGPIARVVVKDSALAGDHVAGSISPTDWPSCSVAAR
jgi:hypothetical protein